MNRYIFRKNIEVTPTIELRNSLLIFSSPTPVKKNKIPTLFILRILSQTEIQFILESKITYGYVQCSYIHFIKSVYKIYRIYIRVYKQQIIK